MNANEQGNSHGQELALVLQAFWAEGCIRNKRNRQPCHPCPCTALPVHTSATTVAINAAAPTLAGSHSHPHSQPAWLLPAQTFSFL